MSLEPNSTTRTPATDTMHNGQADNNSTTNLPHRNARAQHLDMSRCWDVANFCPLVVFVAGVRSRCPCSGVWLLTRPQYVTPRPGSVLSLAQNPRLNVIYGGIKVKMTHQCLHVIEFHVKHCEVVDCLLQKIYRQSLKLDDTSTPKRQCVCLCPQQ